MVHRTVVVAPGHGVVRTPERPLEQRSWVGLYPYPEEAELLFEHCRAAVAMVVSDPGARLVFTGGPTQRAAGPVSEAAGYREMARAAGWWGCPEVEGRTLVEEYATDSLQNLVFAICRYRTATGVWPDRLAVVGWQFKEQRFRQHAESIGWSGPLQYFGVNDPPRRDGVLARALDGERRKCAALALDPYLHGAEWRAQRAERNPFGRSAPYASALPELAPFLKHLFADGPKVPPPWAECVS